MDFTAWKTVHFSVTYIIYAQPPEGCWQKRHQSPPFEQVLFTVLSLLKAPGVEAVDMGASISHQESKENPINY